MTVLRANKGAISNYFDRLLQGLGQRGSSFTDLDAVTHDGATGRCLIQEFKRTGEPLPTGQRQTLEWLARQPRFTVWLVIRGRDDASLQWADARRLTMLETITVDEYRHRFRRWWAAAGAHEVLTASTDSSPAPVSTGTASYWAEPPPAGPRPPDGLCEKCGKRTAVSPWKMWMCFSCHPMGTCAPNPDFHGSF